MGCAAVRGSASVLWCLLSLNSKSMGSDDLLGGMLLTGLWCLLSLNEKQARLRSDFSDSQPRLSHTFTLLHVWDVQKLIACFVF